MCLRRAAPVRGGRRAPAASDGGRLLEVAERDRDVVGDRALRTRGDQRVVDAVDVDERAAAVAALLPGERNEGEDAIGTDELAVPERNERGAARGH